MKLLIHDYPPEEFAPLAERYEGWDVISDDGTIRPCIGCFGCWVKTPGQCVIRDGYETNARRLHEAEEVVVRTKWTYGCGARIRKFFDCKEWCSPFGGCTISSSQAESLYFCGFSRMSSISFWSSFSSGMVNIPIAVK